MKAYYVTCVSYKKDLDTGKIIEVHCTYDPETKGGWSQDGRKVKGTSHWVSARHCIDGEVRNYDHLFTRENPEATEEGKEFSDYINPDSLVVQTCKMEPSLNLSKPGNHYQFLRVGYFCTDKDSKDGKYIFNKTVGLQDKWAKIEKSKLVEE